MEFVVPVYTEDLEVSRSDAFCIQRLVDVETDTDVDGIIDALDEYILNNDDVVSLALEHKVMDTVYSLIKYWTLLSAGQQQRLLELLTNFVNDLYGDMGNQIGRRFAEPVDKNRHMSRLRNAFKCTLYFYCTLIQVAEKLHTPAVVERRKGGRAGAAGAKGKGRSSSSAGGARKGSAASRKAAARVAEEDDDTDADDEAHDGDEDGAGAACADKFDWPSFRPRCLRLLVQAVSIDFRQLWSMGLPEEEFINVFNKTAQRMLGSADTMKDADARRLIIDLLAIIGHRFPAAMAAASAGMVAALIGTDHVGAILTQLVAMWGAPASRVASPTAVAELLRELGRLNASATKDTATLRRAGQFIVSVSEKAPRVVMQNMAVLLPYMDCDSHTLRSALVNALSNVLLQLKTEAPASEGEQSSQEGAIAPGADASSAGISSKSRTTLFEALAQRAYDVHAFTRAAVLKAWTSLVAHATVPAANWHAVTALAVDRLRDKSANVRRAAGALLRALLENNPFGPRIDATVFKEQGQAAEAWLREHAPEALGEAPVASQPDAVAQSPDSGMRSERSGDDATDAADAADERLIAQVAAESDAAAAAELEASQMVALSSEAAQALKLRDECIAAHTFATNMGTAVPIFQELMMSTTSSDVKESIRFLSKARDFGLPGADTALAGMLALVWSTEQSVREEVISTFDRLYILQEGLEEDDEDAVEEAGDDGTAPEEAFNTQDARNKAPAPTAAATHAAAAAAKRAPPARKARASASASRARDEEDDDSVASLTDAEEEADAFDSAEDGEEDDAAGKPTKGSQRGRGSSSAAGRGRGRGRGGASAAKATSAVATKPKTSAPRAPKSGLKGEASAASAAAAAAVSGSAIPQLSPAAQAARAASVDPVQLAAGLMSLLHGATLAITTSLEEVLSHVSARGMLPSTCTSVLLKHVASGVNALHRFRTQCAAGLSAFASDFVRGSGASASARVSGGAAQAPPSFEEWLQYMSIQRRAVDSALLTARYALNILSMLASGKDSAVARSLGSTLATYHQLAGVLVPQPVAGLPAGVALMEAVLAVCRRSAPGDDKLAARTLAVFDLAACAGDYRMARHACTMLQRLAPHFAHMLAPPVDAGASGKVSTGSTPVKAGAGSRSKASAKSNAPAASSPTHDDSAQLREVLDALLTAIVDMLCGAWDGGDVDNQHWYSAAQSGIDAAFAFAARPAHAVYDAVRTMTEAACAPTLNAVVKGATCARLFFAVGHLGVKVLIHVDGLTVSLKQLRIRAAEARESQAAAKRSAGVGAKSAAKEAGGLEDQLGASAAEDEKEAECAVQILEAEVLTSGILAEVAPLIKAAVEDHLSPGAGCPLPLPVLQSALLSLSKLMCVSSAFCEAHMQLLFTALTSSPVPSLRAVTSTCLGDLTFRFPNIIEPYTEFLYARLRDADVSVRKNMLLVLSHLILNGMIKTKGQIGQIAVCLHDTDERLVDLTRLFFTELSKRGNNPIYNIFPDTLSCLSQIVTQTESGVAAVTYAGTGLRPFDRAAFRDVIKYLLNFIGKDKQSEGLASKLLHRIETSPEVQTHRDVAFCLQNLLMTEKVVKQLMESVRLYKSALHDDEVWSSFSDLNAKVRRFVATHAELKDAAAEWEAALQEGRQGAVENAESDKLAKANVRRAAALAGKSGSGSKAAVPEASLHAGAASSGAGESSIASSEDAHPSVSAARRATGVAASATVGDTRTLGTKAAATGRGRPSAAAKATAKKRVRRSASGSSEEEEVNAASRAKRSAAVAAEEDDSDDEEVSEASEEEEEEEDVEPAPIKGVGGSRAAARGGGASGRRGGRGGARAAAQTSPARGGRGGGRMRSDSASSDERLPAGAASGHAKRGFISSTASSKRK